VALGLNIFDSPLNTLQHHLPNRTPFANCCLLQAAMQFRRNIYRNSDRCFFHGQNKNKANELNNSMLLAAPLKRFSAPSLTVDNIE